MRPWLPYALLLVACVCRLEAQWPPVRNLQIVGKAEYSFWGSDWHYYVLHRSTDLQTFLPVTALHGGRLIRQTIKDELPPPNGAFYRVQSVPFSDPLDTDGDGMDDRYELWHSHRLDMLNAIDASVDPEGDGRTHLDDYRSLMTMGLQDVGVNEGITGGTVAHLVTAPSDPRTIYANTWNAVFRSVDGGEALAVCGYSEHGSSGGRSK